MGLFDGQAEEPQNKRIRYAVTGMVFALLMSLGVAYLYRYHEEKNTVRLFLDTLVAGDLPQAYRIWKANPNYTFDDFQKDWGPAGEFGPVKSYRFETAQKRDGASGVIIVIEVSKFQPFPTGRDSSERRQNKEIRLWVESGDKAISFAP